MKKILLIVFLTTFASLSHAAARDTKNAFEQFYSNLNNLELEIAGTGHGRVRDDIPGDEGKEYWCFDGIPMYDKKSRLLVGYAEDCLSGVVNDNGAVSVNPGFTFFNFFAPNENWVLMVTGNISVQPTVVRTETSWGLDVTHITGSSASDGRGNNTCVGGTGPFDGAKCVSRISGMVDMSNVSPTNIPNSSLTFSCFFSIEGLKLKQRAIRIASRRL